MGKLEIRSSGVGIFSLEDGIFTKAEERIVPQTHVPLRDLEVVDSVLIFHRVPMYRWIHLEAYIEEINILIIIWTQIQNLMHFII